jgi:hypothetical protein
MLSPWSIRWGNEQPSKDFFQIVLPKISLLQQNHLPRNHLATGTKSIEVGT